MFRNINKSNLIWCIAYISAIICLAWIFPVLLFKATPHEVGVVEKITNKW